MTGGLTSLRRLGSSLGTLAAPRLLFHWTRLLLYSHDCFHAPNHSGSWKPFCKGRSITLQPRAVWPGRCRRYAGSTSWDSSPRSDMIVTGPDHMGANPSRSAQGQVDCMPACSGLRPGRGCPDRTALGSGLRGRRSPVGRWRVQEPSGLVRLALMHLEWAARWGVPRAELLREARLDEAQLRDPDARIPRSAIVRLWHAVAARRPDPTFGLRLGVTTRAREFGLVGYTLAYSQTVGAALQRLTRYDRILSDTLVVALEAQDEATWVRLDVEPALHAFRPAVDFRLAALLAMCREIAAAPIAPLTVQLPYRRPEDIRE